jgi:hypothetical protein
MAADVEARIERALASMSALKSLTRETCHPVQAPACQRRGLLADVRGDPVTW